VAKKKKDLVKLKQEAMQLALKGKAERALKLYQQIVQQDPKDLKTWVKIGDLYKRLQRLDQAVEIYAKTARSYAVHGFLMQAISVNKMILEIDPDHEETQAALAELYAQKESADVSRGTPSAKAGGVVGASDRVLQMLKRKDGGAKPSMAKPEPKPAEQAQAASSSPASKAEEAESTEVDVDVDVSADTDASETAPASAKGRSGAGGAPQFDAVDLDLADDLFDQIMNEEVVVVETPDDASKILSRLPEIPLFSHLTTDEFMGIVERINLRRFDTGDKIIKEGEPGDAFYIIARGSAKVHKQDPTGKDVELAVIGEGAFFGEFAFFSESVRHASVTVAEEMEALEIDRLDLAELISQFPRIQDVMKSFYKERLIGTMLKISPFFQPLSEADRAAILAKFEEIDAPVGAVLIRQNQQGEGLFVIVQGEVAVTVKGAEGEAVEVARLREGDFFGEISLITDKPTTANCIVVKEGTVYKLPRATFKALIAEYPKILEVTAEYADQRVKQTRDMVVGGEALQKAGIV